jgi:hypothetical protein
VAVIGARVRNGCPGPEWLPGSGTAARVGRNTHLEGAVSSWEIDGASLLLLEADATLPELTATFREQLLAEQRRLVNE